MKKLLSPHAKSTLKSCFLFLSSLVFTPAFSQTYCQPIWQYNSDGNMITRVEFNTINNTSPFTSGSTPSYEDFRAISTSIEQGSTHTIHVKAPSSTFPSDIAAYFDFNQDGTYDHATEFFYIGRVQSQNPANAETITQSIYIPANTPTGNVTIRIIKATNLAAYSDALAPNIITEPCGSYRSGQVEEYTIQITAASTPQTYCEPTVEYGIEPISHVILGTINNTTSAVIDGTPAYEDFTHLSTELIRGQSYTLNVKGNTAGPFDHDIRLFIDWDNNLEFTTATEYYWANLEPSSGEDLVNAQITFTVPTSANLGSTRLRIIKDQWNVYEIEEIEGCMDAYYGQIEDYTVIIQEALSIDSVVITVSNNASTALTSINETVQLQATVYPLTSPQDVTWAITSGSTFVGLTPTGLVSALSNGTAVIRATSNYDQTIFDEINVIVNIPEVETIDSVKITAVNNQTTITSLTQTVQLLATIYPTTFNQNVTWSIVSGASNATLSTTGLVTPLQSGSVVIQATSVEDPTKFHQILITINVTSLSIGDYATPTNFSIYPNPTSDLLMINGIENELTAIEIIDQTGKLIQSLQLGHHQNIIPVNHLQTGNYYIRTNGTSLPFVKH